MDAAELAFRERYRPSVTPAAAPELPAPAVDVADPTEDLPLFINVGSPTSDAAIERLFTQEGN